MTLRPIGFFAALLVLLYLPCSTARGGSLHDAFGAEDIDWENTIEAPTNDAIHHHPSFPYREGVMASVGVINPDGDPRLAGLMWVQGGARGYCRLAFKKPVAIGTIVQGATWMSTLPQNAISVLKPDAPYPGDMENEAQWQKLEHLPSNPGVTLDVLPPKLTTRAVRIESAAMHMRFLAARYANLTPQATVLASGGEADDLRHDKSWVLRTEKPVGPDNPQWIVLTWEKPQTLAGLLLTRPIFKTFEVSCFTGAADADPLGAPPSSWKKLADVTLAKPWRTGSQSYVDFPASITTTAIRVRITEAFDEVEGGGGPNLLTLRGIVALTDLGDAQAPSAVDVDLKTTAWKDFHAPIPMRFTLKEPGDVTLVIEDANGRRVRNVVSETLFPAGENVAWWDGLDESVQLDHRVHGVYTLSGKLVQPGSYRVRGIVHKRVNISYEMAAYTGGDPSWFTPDNSGGWLADESVPSGIVFVPGKEPRVLVSSWVAEAGHGLAWLDLTGKKRMGIRGVGLGGGWCGGLHVVRDAGPKAIVGVDEYVDSPFNGQYEIWTIATNGAHRRVYIQPLEKADNTSVLGFAAYNGVLASAFTKLNELAFINAADGKVIARRPLADPRGLMFDAKGQLYALSHDKLLRIDQDPKNDAVVIASGFEDPQQIALDDAGNFYVSDWGKSHQVKVFTPDGKPLRTIGTAGGPIAGPYDETRMFNPMGVAISSDGNVWVAEASWCPKRVSIWTSEGKLVRAMYGPSQYGGAGAIDHADKSLLFVNSCGGSSEVGGTLQFRLDWEKGTNKLESIPFIHKYVPLEIPATPQYPIVVNGRRYLTNLYGEGATNGESVAFFWIFKDGIATPCGGIGGGWELLRDEKFRERWPAGVDLKDVEKTKYFGFSWSDTNGDGQPQPAEVQIEMVGIGTLQIERDLSLTSANAIHFPCEFAPNGAPIFDLAKRQVLVPKAQGAQTSGGAGAISGRNGWTVMLWEPQGFPHGYIYGAQNGQVRWTYPCETIGLHASASAPVPRWSGNVQGITHLIGPTFTPKGTDEQLWTVLGNKGVFYVMTTDGLFVSQLFKDERQASPWPSKAVRGANLTDCTVLEEDFNPTITQTDDGNLYVVCRHAQSVIARVDGLSSIRRLPDVDLAVTPELLAEASTYFAKQEERRLANRLPDMMNVSIRGASDAPKIDGKLDDWKQAQWVRVDEHVTAAVTVAGDRLYAAYVTGGPGLLANAGGATPFLYKSGGALDVMIGANPSADDNRHAPAAGDVRLLVTILKDKPVAVLYRPVSPAGVKAEPVQFVSPVKTLSMDRVDDISGEMQFAATADGNYEFSIPLATLGLAPKPGLSIRGDIGIVRGDGTQSLQRLFWHNKMTGTVSDLPSEAELTPNLWGRWRFLGQ